MRLKQQLLLVSMVLLVLPWGGYHMIQQLESALRDIQQENLRRALLLARSRITHSDQIRSILTGLNPQVSQVYAYRFTFAPITDGYADEWNAFYAKPVPLLPISDNGFSATYLAGFFRDRLYMFLQVKDSQVIYYEPYRSASPDSDRVSVELTAKLEQGNSKTRVIQFQPIAPGPISAVALPDTPNDISAYWQDTPAGYNVEFSIPWHWVTGGLALSVIDETADPLTSEPNQLTLGAPISGKPALNKIVRREPELERLLADYAMPTTRITLIDTEGWVIARSGRLGQERTTRLLGREFFTDFLGTVFRWWLLEDAPPIPGNDDPALDRSELMRGALAGVEQTLWFTSQDNHSALSSVALPVSMDEDIVGALRIDQQTNSFATLSSRTIVDVILVSFAIYLLVTLILLGFASFISYRIRRLNQSIKEIVSPDGQILGEFSASKSNDEIGDLSRNFKQMVAALNGYTHYLETFARKLSHEIKTPVAIVRSSLENLNQGELAENQQQYVERAKDGCSRLTAILNSMREATRLEDSIQHAEKEWFDLGEFLSSIAMAYQGMLTDFRFSCEAPECGERPFWGSPDLLAQMLDKLIENAKDFTPSRGKIGLTLTGPIDRADGRRGYELSVFNEGSLLPDTPGRDIFSSFVSLRNHDNDVHLGIGLVIVKLIALFHDGDVKAVNDRCLPGVCFTIWLPLAQNRPD